MPAVINILLGLRQRDATGEGVHLDIAMTDAMFTFAWYALAIGQATGKFPGPGELRARRRLAALPALSDPRRQARRLRRAGAEILARLLPQRSALPATLIERSRRSGGHQGRRSRRSSRARPPPHWRPKFAAADCCVTIMASLEEALDDPHFVERGLFAHQVTGRRARPCRRCRCRSRRPCARPPRSETVAAGSVRTMICSNAPLVPAKAGASGQDWIPASVT